MDDFSDKPTNKDVVYENVDGDKVETYDLDQFINKCNGKTRPVIIRPELVDGLSDEEIASQPIYVRKALAYTDRWLEAFDGKTHNCVCCTCTKDFECKAENCHDELGGLAVLLPWDEEASDAGAMVFAI